MTDPLIYATGYDLDTTTGDVQVDDAGRPLLLAGLAQYWQRNGRLLAATPGTVLGYPTVGAGLDAAVEEPLTAALVQALQADATATLEADPLTASVESVSLLRNPMTPGLLVLTSAVTLIGTVGPTPLTWSFPLGG